MLLFSSLIFCDWTFILRLSLVLFLFTIFAKLSLKFVLCSLFFFCFFVIVFYLNSKYILLEFSFLLLSYREKNHFVISGSQIYVSIKIIIIVIIIIDDVVTVVIWLFLERLSGMKLLSWNINPYTSLKLELLT